MRKNLLFAGMAMLSLLACNDGANLKGTVTGTESDTLIVFVSDMVEHKQLAVDTVPLVNNQFSLSVPDTVLLGLQIVEMPQGNKAMRMLGQPPFLFFPGDKMELRGDVRDRIEAMGTTLYDALAHEEGMVAIEKRKKALENEFTALYRAKDMVGVDSLRALLREQQNLLNEAKLQAIQNNPNSLLAGYLTMHLTPEEGLEAADLLTDEVKNGPLGKLIEKSVKGYERAIAREKAKENIKPGLPAPDFSLKGLDGKRMTLADFRGKYVLLDFWGTWCGWCIKGIPHMKEYYAKYSDKVEFVGICCGDKEDKWRAGVAEHELPWVNLYGDDTDVSTVYAISGYPSKVLLDGEGKIVEIFVGESQHLYDKLDELFK